MLIAHREEVISLADEGPIYICTRNDDLDGIIDRISFNRREDMVFLQNGMIKDYLLSKGLHNNTKALIYYAITKKGDSPVDGKTDHNPEGLTVVTGKWAEDFAARMVQAGLSCQICEEANWEVAMVSNIQMLNIYIFNN